MATGHYDPDGFWIYGEDDLADEGTGFSEVLNKSAKAIPDAVHSLVVGELSSDPTIQDAAVEAVNAEIEGRDMVEGFATDGDELLIGLGDDLGQPTWVQARKLDGGPTDLALKMLIPRIEEIAPLPSIADVPGVLVTITDADGNRTWLEARAEDGGPTEAALEILADRLGTVAPTALTYICHGDSITQGGHGVGATWPALLAAEAGIAVRNRGVSGSKMDEIAMWGGVVELLTIAGGQIPASGSVNVTMTNPGPWSSSTHPNRVYAGTIRGVAVTLTYNTTTAVWTITRVVNGAAIPVASPIAFVPTGADMVPRTVHIMWGGRNNGPKSTTFDGVEALVNRLPSGAPFLILSILNAVDEPSGSAGYLEIVAENARIQARWPYQYVDMRGRLIREGLALAGITPTAGDTTAIGQDRIPPSLMEDNLHPNGAGRVAIAHLMKNELQIRSLL